MSTADAALIALGDRFERRLLEYMDAWLAGAPLMRAARAEAESDLGHAPGGDASHAADQVRTGRQLGIISQHCPYVACLDTNHWQARFGENAVKPLRQRSSFQPNSLEVIDGVRQDLQQSLRFTCHPRFPHD